MASDRIAIVTGAGTGVGRDTAIALASDGYAIGLIGRRRDALEESAARIAAAGGRATVAPADVGDESAIQEAIEAITAELGGVDVAVCAAAVGLYGPVEGYTLADWRQTLDTNVTGVFLVSQAVLPLMRTRGGGAIIAIGSGAGKRGYANLAAYSASKFALLGFMESLAAEVGPYGIKVATINPGSILTGFAGRSIDEKLTQREQGRKYLETADVVDAIRFLLQQSGAAWTQEMNLWPF